MLESFIRRQTTTQYAALVPEIALLLARDPRGIFTAAEAELPADTRQHPLWAFAWPGGQALARFVLDHPEMAANRRVIDIGAGSGIASIAAAMAGASHVTAADTDPCAEVATLCNAVLNRVTVATVTGDVIGTLPPSDLILIADLVYEPALATRIAAFIETVEAAGANVLLADRTNARRPPGPFELIAEYDAALTPPIPELPFDKARLWRLGRRRARKAPRSTPGNSTS